MRPSAARFVGSSAAFGAEAATRSRYERQSLACTCTVRVASCGGPELAVTSAALGIVMIAPRRRRFMLLPSNALALLLKSATSIWSSVAVSGL